MRQLSERTNEGVVQRFVNGEFGHSASTVRSTEGGELYSYGAMIAEFNDDGTITVYDGWDGYSKTTSKHMGYLHRHLEDSGVEYEATHEPEGKGTRKDRWD